MNTDTTSTTAPRKRGRPFSDNPRKNAVMVRLTAEELTQLTAAADACGVALSAFLRLAALELLAQGGGANG